MLDLWNGKRGSLPKVVRLVGSRERQVRARLKEHPDMTYWSDVFDRIQAFPFLLGMNPRGWKVSFDWVMKNPENHLKVLEGKYG